MFRRSTLLVFVALAALIAPDVQAWEEFSAANPVGIEGIVSPSARRSPGGTPQKVAASLRRAVARMSSASPSAPAATPAASPRWATREWWQDGKTLVVVNIDPSAGDLRAPVVALGGEVRTGLRDGRMEVWIPPDGLDALAALPGIQYVREPARLVHSVGSVTTSEVADSGVAAWHTAGYSGAGVRIGIVDSFLDYDLSQASGDWPSGAQLEIHNIDGGAFGEFARFGTGMVEIMYDMAPGATFVVYEVSTVADFGTAIDQSVTDGVDILLLAFTEFGGVAGLGDGDPCAPHATSPCGSIAERVQAARASGVFVVASAGNFGASHWAGFYDPHPTYPYFNEFSDGKFYVNTTVCLPEGVVSFAEMSWADPAVTSDYDLYVYLLEDTGAGGNSLTLVAVSEDDQMGQPGQYPFESVSFTAGGQTFGCAPASSSYVFIVARFNAPTNRLISLFSAASVPLDPAVRMAERSIRSPADLAAAYTVTGVDTATMVQGAEMGRGPLFGPGITFGPPVVDKPDATGADTATTTASGLETYIGSSVSAAMVVGQAAVVRESDPSLTADGLRAALNTFAAANPIPDTTSDEVGAGLVRLGTNPPPLDSDGDGVFDDGDDSGVAGDNPCLDGQTTGCDDNCATVVNVDLPDPTFLGFGDQADRDDDGVGDLCDNCVLDPNGPTIPDAGGNSQRNTNGDLYGNVCDGDLDGSGLIDAADESQMNLLIQFSIYDEHADLDGDADVDNDDLQILLPLGGAPGPAAGEVQCNNGLDDDGDTAVDYPADPFCAGDPTLDDEGPTGEVHIVDDGLRAAINAALSKPAGAAITLAEMLSLVTLDASGRAISDLSGLQAAANLVTLDLRNNALSDLSLLASLPSLETVYLYGNPGVGMPCDLDGNGGVGVEDALAAYNLLMSPSAPTHEQLAVADVAPASGPGDGVVNVADVLLVLRSSTGLTVAVCEFVP